jgi:hypothetical protein
MLGTAGAKHGSLGGKCSGNKHWKTLYQLRCNGRKRLTAISAGAGSATVALASAATYMTLAAPTVAAKGQPGAKNLLFLLRHPLA